MTSNLRALQLTDWTVFRVPIKASEYNDALTDGQNSQLILAAGVTVTSHNCRKVSPLCPLEKEQSRNKVNKQSKPRQAPRTLTIPPPNGHPTRLVGMVPVKIMQETVIQDIQAGNP